MSAAELFADARRRLAGAPQEALGELVSGRRMLGIPRADRIVPRGQAWHLGALLITGEEVLATGEIVRAREEIRRGYAAESQRRRAQLAAAARRGGFAEGEVVHLGWERLDPDRIGSGGALMAIRDGVPSIRWSAAGSYTPLDRYLDERIDLLLHPSAGAS